jgi:toxin CptA
MQRPPAVSFMVSRSIWHARLVIVGWFLGVSILFLFFQTQPLQSVLGMALACVALLAGMAAFAGWSRSHEGELKWDGDSWHWAYFEGQEACNLNLHLDFQSVMLVCIDGPQTPKTWLWLEANPSKPGWSALRRAVVASQGNAFDPNAGQVMRHN